MKQKRILNGLVLAGGYSKRMGQDKAAMLHPDGRPLCKRTVDLLQNLCSSVTVSLRSNQIIPPEIEEYEKVHIVRDPEGESQGPMTGIITAMRSAPEADWLILACDLPKLDEKTLAHLVNSRNDNELFLSYRSEFDQLPEPLCAIYAAESLPLFENAVANAFCCPRKVLIQNHCRLLEPHITGALANANTPEDWQAATTS